MKIGRRIFYDVNNGAILVDTGEWIANFSQNSAEEDKKNYTKLTERNENSYDYIELEYGQYREDFASSNGYRVNPETKELEFSYPDPNEPDEDQEPVYQEPLTEQIKILGQDVTDSKIESMEQGQRQSDFDIRLLELEMGAK